MRAPSHTPGDIRLRHRIETTFVERVAACDPAHREPPAAARAEALDRLIAVVGARGLVAAGAHHSEQRANRDLVDPNEHQADAFHARTLACEDREALASAVARPARRLRKGISVARPGRLTTMSSPGCSRRTGAMAARNRRRARLRLTAPVAPGTAKATREKAVAPSSARTRMTPERASLPVSRTAAIRRRPGRRCRAFIA